MKIIITGATGAFGGAMVRYFAKKGHDIIATGRSANPPKRLLELASYIRADITQPYDLPQADVIIHAAALSDDKASSKDLYTPNVIGTINTADAASKCGTFIFISSSSVYLPDENIIKETNTEKQNNKKLSPYGYSKLLSEEALKEVFTGERCFILRARAFYGPGDTKIMPRMMKLVKNDVFKRPGKMKIQLSMTHYYNMAHAIECCFMSEHKGVRTYNVADDEIYTMITTLRKLFNAIYGKTLEEKEISIQFLKALAVVKIGGLTPLLIRGLTQNMVLDIGKLKKETEYESIITFEDSLADIKDWIKKIGGADILQEASPLLNWQGN
jgi:nucleoside-diphosphate-sugar epimerase